jgi:hypothetical protein
MPARPAGGLFCYRLPYIYRAVFSRISAIRKKVMILKSKVKDIEREGVMGQMSKNQAFWGLGRD